MKTIALILTFGLLALAAAPACADIVGSSVTGVMAIDGNSYYNYYDPSWGLVPAGYGNTSSDTVVIGPGPEFGFNDGYNLDVTDFTSTGLTFTDTTFAGGTQTITFFFTDPAFTGFTLVSSDFAGLTYSFSGDTFQFTFPDTDFTGTETIVFDYASPAATPELGSLALLGTGALGILGELRRRRIV